MIITSAFSQVVAPPPASAASTQMVFEFSETVSTAQDTRKRSAAFHSMTFLNIDGSELGTLYFGSSVMNAYQGDGWYGNEASTDIGAYQWAGGESRRATLSLNAPAGAEAILLHLRGAKEDVRVYVYVNGEHTTSLQVDEEWARGYVPLNDPIPAWDPDKVPEWTEGRLWPHFTQAERLFVIHVETPLVDVWGRPAAVDWRITESPDTEAGLTLAGMQGLINRMGPEVYLEWDDQGTNRDQAKFWLSELEKCVKVIRVPLQGDDAIRFLAQRYSHVFEGAVIYDPDVPDTINLATMIAGLNDYVILSPDQAGEPWMPRFESVTDLRDLAAAQGWDATIEGQTRIYEWVYDNIWPDLDHRIIGVVSPGPPTSRKVFDDQSIYYPLNLVSRDYMVALRLAVVWLDPSNEPQKSLFERYLDDAPPMTPVTGFFATNEPGTVFLATTHGDWVPVTTIGNGPLSAANLSAFGGVRPEIVKYDPAIDVDRIFSTLGDDPVMTLYTTDGDSIIFNMEYAYWWERYWPSFQYRYYGRQTNPTLIDLAPVVWNYFTQEASMRTRGLAALNGLGYSEPYYMSDEQFDEWLEYAAVYLDATGIRSVIRWPAWLESGGYEPVDSGLDAKYYEALKDHGYLGNYFGVSSGGQFGTGFMYLGSPAPTALAPYYVAGSETDRDEIVEDILKQTSSRSFIDLSKWMNHFEGMGQEVYDGGSRSEKAILFRKEDTYRGLIVTGCTGSLAPGEYTVTYRLKVGDNTRSTNGIALFTITRSESGDWTFLDREDLAPNDFLEAGEYQNFTLSFTLDRFASNAEFMVEKYDRGASPSDPGYIDLYVDCVWVEREEDLGMPKFSPVVVYGWYEPYAEALGVQFAQAGGLVLHPDEFLAALNPEFMLEWAAPILGEDSAGLSSARQKLSRGDYLGSLLATRAALTDLPERTYSIGFEEGGEHYEFRLRADTYVDPIGYDPASYSVIFSTHGPPVGEAAASVTLPVELDAEKVKINVDGARVSFTSESNSTHTILSFAFPQGAHSVQVALPFNEPPEASFYTVPERPSLLDAVSFKDTSSDADGVITSWSWSFGDGSVSSVRNPVHRYAAKGSYTVRLVVRDDGGAQGEDVGTVQVVNLPPEAGFTVGPETLLAEEEARFTNLSRDPDGRVARYYWDFGDGTGSTLANPVHVYQAPGERSVRLTAWDDDGSSDTDALTIYVNRLYTLTVSVKDRLGVPVSGAVVEVRQGGDVCGGGSTDASGEAEVQDLHPGTYEVRATSMGATAASVVSVDADESVLVTVTLSIPVISIAVALLAVIALILRWRTRS